LLPIANLTTMLSNSATSGLRASPDVVLEGGEY
jgi:hypothetical protein